MSIAELTCLERVCITGLGHHLPERVVENKELYEICTEAGLEFNLEETIKKSGLSEPGQAFDWQIQKTVGVKSRRFSDLSAERLGVRAAENAIKDARIDPKDIEYVLVATSTPDRNMPAAAYYIVNELGLGRTPGLTINTACTGYLSMLYIAEAFMKAHGLRTILAVNCERFSRVLDYRDFKTAILFGDGAGAAILQSESIAIGPKFKMLPGFYNATLYHDDAIVFEDVAGINGNRAIKMKTETQKYAINAMRAAAYASVISNRLGKDYLRSIEERLYSKKDRLKIDELLPGQDITLKQILDSISYFLFHQASGGIVTSLAGHIGDPELKKTLLFLSDIANMSGVAMPIGLEMLKNSNLYPDSVVLTEGARPALKPGDIILLAKAGAGFNCAAGLAVYSVSYR